MLKVLFHPDRHLPAINLTTEFFRHRRDSPVGEATRIDVIEVGEITVHVQCQPMHGDKPACTHTYRTDLSCSRRMGRINPDPHGFLIFFPVDTVLLERCNHHILQQRDIFFNAYLECFQVNDRIDHQLSWAVVGDISSAVNLMEVNVLALADTPGDKEVLPVAALPDRVHMFMFTKEQILVLLLTFIQFLSDYRFKQFLLVIPCLLVSDTSQLLKDYFPAHAFYQICFSA